MNEQKQSKPHPPGSAHSQPAHPQPPKAAPPQVAHPPVPVDPTNPYGLVDPVTGGHPAPYKPQPPASNKPPPSGYPPETWHRTTPGYTPPPGVAIQPPPLSRVHIPDNMVIPNPPITPIHEPIEPPPRNSGRWHNRGRPNKGIIVDPDVYDPDYVAGNAPPQRRGTEPGLSRASLRVAATEPKQPPAGLDGQPHTVRRKDYSPTG